MSDPLIEMESKDHIIKATETLQNQVEYLKREYDLSLAEMLGILECIKLHIYTEAVNDSDDE